MSNESNTNDSAQGEGTRRLMMEAMIGEMRRMMRTEMEQIHARLDRVENAQPEHQPRVPNVVRRGRAQPREIEEEFDDFEEHGYEDEDNRRFGENFRRFGGNRGARNFEDGNTGSIKMKVPSFQGKSDPEVYFEWETKVQFVFDCHNYTDYKKVKLAAAEFTDYAIVWWDQLVSGRRRAGERPIDTWDEMKAVMRKRFVPRHYYRELYKKLQQLRQGSRSVEEYYREMEVAMIRANVDEDREATMARFVNGLNTEIANQAELQHYVEMEDLLHMAIKIERQLKTRGSTRFNRSPEQSSWKRTFTKEDKTGVKPKVDARPTSSTSSASGKPDSLSTRNRDIKCFKCQGRGHISTQCPNKKSMMLLESGDIVTDDEGECNVMPPLEDISEDECEAAPELVLVSRRALNAQAKESDEEQRENIFHTRCQVKDKVCSMIIDGGSCTNVASIALVKKLGLPTTSHPRPYKLQWFNDGGEVRVNKQVLVSFQVGRYEDEVLCDVAPMDAGHILLGRPWQFDRRVKHDGFTNKYSLVHNNRTFTLVPLTPQQVHEDQMKMQHERERQKKMSAQEKKREFEHKNRERA